MGVGSPFVGKGPEVDKAWHAISYDSQLLMIQVKTHLLTMCSRRSDDYSSGVGKDCDAKG
jgi:hypothetical protein